MGRSGGTSKTPDAIIQKVSADLQQAASSVDLQKKLAELGSYTRPMTSAEATLFVQNQQSLWGPVLADIARQEQQKGDLVRVVLGFRS